jgi:hypothetical protein
MGFWGKFFHRNHLGQLKLGKKSLPDAYRFTNGESFRYCTEGLHHMQEWQRTGLESERYRALEKFEESVDKYPNDLIALFYRACLRSQKEIGREAAIRDWVSIEIRAPGTDLAVYARRNIDLIRDFVYSPKEVKP